MKTIILAGGFGSRLSEETENKPKPMVEIGNKPIIWHIINIYLSFGFNDFIIALGYKGDYIKKYFLDYINYSGDLTISSINGKKKITDKQSKDWNVNLIDTGHGTNTGGRIKYLKKYIKNETFMLTYGDGVSSLNVEELVKYHKKMGKLVTITAVRPPARFGGLIIDDGKVKKFAEKHQAGEGWINGGFMVFEPEVLEMIEGSSSSLEYSLLDNLAKQQQLSAFCHDGFWQCMDTKRDLQYLEELWASGKAPWKVWNE